MNGTLFTRGLPEDFDGWAADGNEEWSYDKVLPFFVKLESDREHTGEYDGSSGPIPVRRIQPNDWSPITKAFVAACRQAGFPDDPDANSPKSIGVGSPPVNNVDGSDSTWPSGIWIRRSRNNLTVRSDSVVERVLFEDGRAIGVEVRSGANVEISTEERSS